MVEWLLLLEDVVWCRWQAREGGVEVEVKRRWLKREGTGYFGQEQWEEARVIVRESQSRTFRVKVKEP